MSEPDDGPWTMSADDEDEIRRQLKRRSCGLSVFVMVMLVVGLIVGSVVLLWAIIAPIVDEVSASDPPHVGRTLDRFDALLDRAAPEGAVLVAQERDEEPCAIADSNPPRIRRSYDVLGPPEETYVTYRTALRAAGWRILPEEIYGPGVSARKRFGDWPLNAYISQGDTRMSASMSIGCSPIDDQ